MTMSRPWQHNITKTFWKHILVEWIKMVITQFVFEFTVSNTCFTDLLTRRCQTKFVTLKKNDTIYAGKSFNHKRVIP